MHASVTGSGLPCNVELTLGICTVNRASLLAVTLGDLAGQRFPDGLRWEVLVVDNGSTDDTQRVLAQWDMRLPLRIVVESRRGLSSARNRLLAEAGAAKAVLWTDDDVRLPPDWVAEFWRAFRAHPEGAVFGGPIEPHFLQEPDPLVVAAFPALARGFCAVDHALPEGALDPGRTVFGASMGLRLDAVHGLEFDTSLGPGADTRIPGEETDYIRRVRARGGTVVWVPTMRVRHMVPADRMSVDYLRRFTYSQGRGWIHEEGIRRLPGWLGAPRWLARKVLDARLRQVVHRLTGDRGAWLKAVRDAAFYRGAFDQARHSAPKP